MDSPEKTADLSELAKLITGNSVGPEEDRTAILAFLERTGFVPSFAKRLLERTLDPPPRHIMRLVALQLVLDQSNLLNDQRKRRILRTERQLTDALRPPRPEGQEADFDVPAQFRKGSLRNDQKASIDSAVASIAQMAQEMGVEDLSRKSVLDIRCGVKFTQAFFGRQVKVKQYHGVDVDRDMIDYLSTHVKGRRFTYKHIDVYNAMYHKSGPKLSADTDIGAKGRTFDLICLFSVFTHLVPEDFRAMLQLARRYIADDGTLLFTCFVDDTIPGDFKDFDPTRPLLRAIYRESAVRAFARETNWSVRDIRRHPGQQPLVVCSPVPLTSVAGDRLNRTGGHHADQVGAVTGGSVDI
jgi:SAM-dependent methyltransferase